MQVEPLAFTDAIPQLDSIKLTTPTPGSIAQLDPWLEP